MKKETKLIIIIVITVAVLLFLRYRRAKKSVSSSAQTNESGSGFFKPDLYAGKPDLYAGTERDPNGDLFENPASVSSGLMVNSGKIEM